MLVYIFATLISVAFGFVVQHAKKETKEDKFAVLIVKILAMLPLFLVAALRYDVGTDYPYTYKQRFLWRVEGYDLSSIFEFGFIKLIDFIIFFSHNPQWLFVVCAALFSIFTFKAIYQQSNNIAFSILILVIGGHYFANLNLMRNYLALSIVLFAFKYIKEQNLLKYSLWFLVAFLFHNSIIMLYPLYFIYNIKISKQFTIYIIIITAIGLPVLDSLFRYIVSFTDYEWYYNENNSNITPQTSLLLLNTIIIAIQLFYYRKNDKDMYFNMCLKIQLIIVVIAICSFILPMTRRLILIPIFLQILTIPYTTKHENNKSIKFLINLVICSLCIFVTYRQIVVLGMHEVLPYQTIFN